MKTSKVVLVFLLSAIILFTGNVYADVTLPKIFSSNMVLQKGIDIPIWGWADKRERVTVVFNDKVVKTRADKEGKWIVKLPPSEYGGPHKLVVKGKNIIELNNVMIGEVWVCSGQSNMQWRVEQSNNAKEEIVAADLPGIRLFSVPRKVAQFPQEDITDGEWLECSPETVPGFSAVAFFFGRELHRDLNVPVGLIHTSWGGTVAETWASAETIKEDPDFRDKLAELQQMDLDNSDKPNPEKINEILKPNSYPTLLFNAMLNPIIPYGIKGAIWYQGESNASRAKQYQRIFPNMIKDWRMHWQQGEFPFL
ncbi:MAG: sialate O-acetylesterase, partial [Prolixibacteraceae bacterium]|nr:sialate O-acetylesterase [Prolixibacteraceae bacterium]